MLPPADETPSATPDLIDRIAPPPPRTRWRTVLFAGLVAVVVGFVTVERVSSVGGTTSSATVRFTAPDRADVTLFLMPLDGGHTYTGIRSLHDAIEVLAVDGLPRHLAANDRPEPVVVHLAVRCDLLPSDSVELRLDTDDPPWHRIDLRARIATADIPGNSQFQNFACPT